MVDLPHQDGGNGPASVVVEDSPILVAAAACCSRRRAPGVAGTVACLAAVPRRRVSKGDRSGWAEK